ncbi:MAG: NAD(P)-binding domain-containing protein [Bacteroidales bacterium]|nr:NAD(P)-binding domain-containing protein [Bacteroidales bacterium]
MKTKIGILGSGMVGQVLADGFLKHGYGVKIGTRDINKLSDWKARAGEKASLGSFKEAAAYGEILVLAVKGTAALDVLKMAGSENLAGKTILDATNPIDDKAPENGVLRFFTDLDESLMEKLQKAFPNAHFVKVFNSVGNALMVNPDYNGVKPTMFICGNNENAKKVATTVLDQFDWETEDMGMAEAARAIEPLCILWCIPGFLQNSWTHAFKLLKK